MANSEHLSILKQGKDVWNNWRRKKGLPRWTGRHKGRIGVTPDLSGSNLYRTDLRGFDLSDTYLVEANLSMSYLSGVNLHAANLNNANLGGIDLERANLAGVNLRGSNLVGAILEKADLKNANLRGANIDNGRLYEANLFGAILTETTLTNAELNEADLTGAQLQKADLRNSNLYRVNLTAADLSSAILIGVNLQGATLVNTDLTDVTLSNCNVYGVSAWGIKLSGIREQTNLCVTPDDEPAVYVDNLEVAQFVYLLLHNEKIRSVIDTIGEKGVLLLGRFTPERKVVLDAIRNKLRELGFVPMMFDFEKPTQRDFTETIKTLAGMSRFIIADITNPKSAPLELQATMPDYMIPFVPIIQEGEEPFSMFKDLKQKYGAWVLDVLEYDSAQSLIDVMENAVVQPALDKAYELIDRKAEDLKKRHVRDYKKRSDHPTGDI